MTQSKKLNKNVFKITQMTVDEFQTACEDNNISICVIDYMVYELAKALTLSDNYIKQSDKNKNTFIDINNTGGKW